MKPLLGKKLPVSSIMINSPQWLRKVPLGKNGELINPISDYLTKQLSDTTKRSYVTILKLFVCSWLNCPQAFTKPEDLIAVLSNISITDTATFRDAMLNDLAPATVAKYMAAMSGLYEHLLDAGLLAINRNPWNIPRPKVSQEGVTAGFTRMQAQDILAQPQVNTRCGFRDFCMLSLLFGCGLRRNELRNISVEDFEQHTGHMILRLRAKGHQGKTSSVKLRGDIYKTLEGYMKKYRITKGYLFTSAGSNARYNNTGEPLSGTRIWLIMKGYIKKAGLDPAKFTVHSTRVSSITFALESKASLAQVQRHLGRHSDPKTTMRYARIGELDDNAVDYIHLNFSQQQIG